MASLSQTREFYTSSFHWPNSSGRLCRRQSRQSSTALKLADIMQTFTWLDG